MLGFGKNMGILLLSITVILSAATFLTTQNFVETSSTNDTGFLLGHATITVLDENGFVRDYRQTDNVIVDSGWDTLVALGFTGVAGLSTPSGPFSAMGIGTGGITGPDASDEGLATLALDALGTAAACPRSSIEASSLGASQPGGPGTSSIIELDVFAEFDGADCEGSLAIDEAGVFNVGGVPPGGEMFARNTFAPVAPLGDLDVLEIDWTFTFTGAAE